MKRNYVMMAMAAAMLASCAQTGLVEEIAEEPQKAIGFSTFVDKATRAENSDAGYSWQLEEHHKKFLVWGGKEHKNTTLESVYGTGNPGVVSYGTSWTANPLKYWDKAAEKYYFMAAAPSDPSLQWKAETTTDHDFSSATLSLDDFILKGVNLSKVKGSTNEENNWYNTRDLDLMISENTKVLRSSYNKPDPDAVTLNFFHILSRLNIIVKKSESISPAVYVTDLQVYNLKNTGDFDEKNATAVSTQPGSNARWKNHGVATPSTISGYYDAEITTEDKYLIQSLIIPQNIVEEDLDINGTGDKAQAYFHIAYKIGDETYSGYYNLAKVFNTTTFNEGWQNTLTITIAPLGITFAGKVAEWSTNGYTQTIQ